MAIRLGIDLGGTKIEIIALGADGAELLRRRTATPQGDYESILTTIVALVRTTENELIELGVLGIAAAPSSTTVGVGSPGSVSRATGMLRGSNSVCLNGQPIAQHLMQRLGRPVAMANDANCFALSEATDGAGRDDEVVFGVILGTGVGGGIVVRGHVLDGPNGIAGEWGHNALPWVRDDERPGPPCYCGRQGCIETFLSGPGLARDHLQHADVDLAPNLIVRGSLAGDDECSATLQRYEHRLARALASVINVVDPDIVVLGGGLSNIERLYANVPALWGEWIFSDRVDTRLVRNVHGDSSGVRGAAWLAGI